MVRLKLLLICCMFVVSALGQDYFSTISVLDSVGYKHSDVIEKDKFYYVCGDALTTKNEVFLYVSKFDSLGNELWTVWRGDSNTLKWQYANQILSDDTSLYVFGVVYDSVGSNRDISIYKFDFNGNELLFKRFGNPTKEEATRQVVRTKDGGYISVGEARELSSNFVAAYIFKLDKNLNIEWEKRYGLNGVDEWGGG